MIRIQSQSPFAFAPAHIVAILCGLVDSSVWVSAYGRGEYFSLYYAIAVPCKALILLIFMKTVRPGNATLLRPVYLSIGITVCASIILQNTSFEGVVQPVGALVSLALTIMVLSDENITLYMKAFGASCLVSCATFLFQLNFVPLNADGLWELSGRYSFIFGTQPNFGGEILCAGFIAFCIARLNTKLIVSIFTLYFIVINLLESRAALLTLLLAFSVYIYEYKIRLCAPASRVVLTSTLVFLFVIFCLLNAESLSNLFLLQDQYRGIDTGYVGREDRWENAWNIFLQSPIFGIGFGYFRGNVLTPHSMWLGMLGMMGFMSIFVLVAMVKNSLRVYITNRTIFLLLFSFVPLTIFNDRVLNLNPYPFLLFVLLFLPSKALSVGIQGRELRAVRRRDVGAKTA